MVWLAQHFFQGPSGEGSDQIVNTFHLGGVGVIDQSSGVGLGSAIKNFYDDQEATVDHTIAYYMSRGINNPGHGVKIYNLNDTVPRSPVYQTVEGTSPWSVATGSPPMPQEVALCLSYEAIGASGTVRARRRGRIYLGPFNEQANGANGLDSVSSPISGLISAMLEGFQNLVTTTASLGHPVGIYSKTDDLFLPIVRIWVDNAWDTQRRRGLSATGKTEIPLAV